MDKMRVFIRKITSREYLPLWIFAAVQIVYHMMMREPEGSDALRYFRCQLDAFSLKDYLHIRYETWTSRLLIEGVLVFVARNVTLWKVLDWAIWVFLAWALVGLFPKEKREEETPPRSASAASLAPWAVLGFLLIYPMKDLKTAGWIATGVNYTWTLAFGAFSLHGAAKAVRGEKSPVFLWVLYALAALYAANMEQVAAVLVAVNVCAAAYCLMKKEKFAVCGTVWISLFVSAAEMLFILRCPGNAARNLDEIATRMPSFVSYGFLDKLGLGFMDTMHHLAASSNLMFLCYAVLLAALVFAKTENLACRLAAVFPVAFNVVLVGFCSELKIYFPKFFKLMKKSKPIGGSNYHMAANYVPVFLYLLLIGCVILSLIAVCRTYFELFSQMILLAAALATRVVMGFTPTIYVSQERTFLYLYMMLGISGTFLLTEHAGILEEKKKARALKLAGILLSAACLVMNIVEIGSV